MSILPSLRILVILAACAAVAQAKVVYVSTAGSDAGDGLSWLTAKKTVQAGLNAAATGDQVWVAAGTYVERITLVLGVELYGGFAGGETDLSQRNWRTNRTVLDGNQGGSVVTAPTGATASTRIDGFTICNGKASCGGGMYIFSSAPMIANNIITGNNATGGGGGGLYLAYSSSTIVNNTIKGNATGAYGGINGLCGGGVYLYNSSPTFSHNIVKANVSKSMGGGLYLDHTSGTITNNAVTGNSSHGDGGGLYLSISAPLIANNTITQNSTSYSPYESSEPDGGGVALAGSSPTIINNTIVGNSAAQGGGLSLSYNLSYPSSPTIANTIIAFNLSGIYQNGTGGAATLRCNCVYGNMMYDYSGLADTTDTNGNIKADPKLAVPKYGNVHVQPGSPCIDAGNDSDVQAGWVDMDGQPRQNGRVDIGADEADGTLWAATPNAIVRVSAAGNDSNDGSSWALAKRTVQAGINAAAEAGGEVWVAAGTYYERITLQPLAHVYGGFAGSETKKELRDWRAHVTVLDGQQGGSVVTATAGAQGSTIDGFTITNGTGTFNYGGGGLYVAGCAPTIANNTITGNTVSVNGGGLYLAGAYPVIVGNSIVRNAADASGGALYLFNCAPTITNNMIAANFAGTYGSGIFCYSSSPAITNNTITANRGVYGIYCYSFSSPTITNTIIAFNNVGISCASGSPTVRYCCVYDNNSCNYSGFTDPTGSSGNISADPLFVLARNAGPDGRWGTADDDYGDVHLQTRSPCINAGDPAYVAATGETDMDGQSRVIGRRVDIGADEYWAGDINNDGYVNIGDLQSMIAAWGSDNSGAWGNWNPKADLNNNGYIDVGDLQILVANWGTALR